MIDFLNTIKRLKKEEYAVKRAATSLEKLRSQLPNLPGVRDFKAALQSPGISLIAEVKKSSPSAGLIAGNLNPASVARQYEAGGASAISVLTESTYFKGEDSDLLSVKDAVNLPVLRKDFIIDPYQIYESRVIGADAILLIAELLSPDKLIEFIEIAHDLELACLVEAHDREELEKTIKSGAKIIGINNRNLKSLKVDISTAGQLIPLIPEGRIKVAESGIKSSIDVKFLYEAGADAILVGETLVRSKNPMEKTRELLSWFSPDRELQ